MIEACMFSCSMFPVWRIPFHVKNILPAARCPPSTTGHPRAQARRTVSRCMWGISGAVVSGAGGYWYLSYVYLSWDIMVRRPIVHIGGQINDLGHDLHHLDPIFAVMVGYILIGRS